MTVHFVHRSHYEGPMGLYHKQFPEATVLDWFRTHWQGIPDDDGARKHAQKLLGADVYGFASLFQAIAEHDLAAPRSFADLAELLEDHLYLEGELLRAPHLLQMLTDDDEIQLAYYFFDDAYLAKHPHRAAFLLHDDWRLPADAGEGGFKAAAPTTLLGQQRPGQGVTYLIFHGFWDSGNLDDIEGGFRVEGIRLPEFAQYLARAEIDGEGGLALGYDLPVLQELLFPRGRKAKTPEESFLFSIRDHVEDDAPWLIFNDWLAEQGRPSAGALILEGALQRVSRVPLQEYRWKISPKKSLLQVAEHIAQLCRHVGRWDMSSGKVDLFHQWIFFDDLWASAHPDLANAILRFAGRWDVLTAR